MKKISLITYSLLLFLTSCKNEIVKNDLEVKNLKGRVKSIITFSNENTQLEPESMDKYNYEGYLIYQEEYSYYEQYPQINTTLSRDKDNNVIEEIINYKFSHDSSLNNKIRKKYNYNKQNQIIEIIEFDYKEKILSNKEIKYDDRGNIISEKVSNENSFYHTYIYKYDGDKIVEKCDKNMITKTANIHVYDESKEIRTIYKDEKNKVTSTKKILYDDYGNISEEINLDENGTLSSSLKYSYDEKKNLIETKQSDEGKLNSIIKYDYDDIGNWIKETTSYTDAETVIRTRKIEYYSNNEKVDSVTNNTKTDEINKSEKIETKNNLKSFNEIELTLIDATLKKAKIYLGEPDKEEHGFGHISKGFAIYYNKVANESGKPKHLILFLRMADDKQWGSDAKIEEIYSVEDNEKACFGIHCLRIENQDIKTNALDLIYDRGYKSFN